MDKPKLAVFVAGLLVLGSAASSYLFYNKYKSAEEAHAEARAEDAERIKQLEGDLTLARTEISEYQEKVDEAERIAGVFERERDAQTGRAQEYAARIEELEAELEAAERSLEGPPEEPPEGPLVIAGVRGPEEAVGRAEVVGRAEAVGGADVAGDEAAGMTPTSEGSEIEKELDEVRAEKRELEMKYAALVGDKAGGVPIGTVKVVTGVRIKGKVLVVNRRYNFVVVDVGARDGVEKGMVLILHRGKKFIGKCQVEKVYTKMAAADLVLDWMQDEVQVSDGARKF